jgi:hypothetical protein
LKYFSGRQAPVSAGKYVLFSFSPEHLESTAEHRHPFFIACDLAD